MNYKKLGAAIGAALKKSEQSASVGEFCGVTAGAVKGWVAIGCRPEDKNMHAYFRLIKALKIDALEFADFETVAGRITALRFKNELSVSDLLKKCGKKPTSMIHKIEFGSYPVTLKMAAYLAPALNTTPDYILHGDKKVEPIEAESKPDPIVEPEQKYTEVEITFEMPHDKPVLRSGLTQIPPLQKVEPIVVEPVGTIVPTQEMTVFNFDQNTVIRTAMVNGDIWFVAKDLAEALDYSRTSDALEHCKHCGNLPHLNKINNLPPATKWIPESDMFRLIMRSNKAEAEKFQDWVTEDVLPTIRKTGSYSTAPKLEQPTVQLFVTSSDVDLSDEVCNEFKRALITANRCGFKESRAEQYANEKVKNTHRIDVLKTLVGI